MRRGRGQVLYKFLPGQIVDYSPTHTAGMVKKWEVLPVDVDMTRLVSSIQRASTRFGTRIAGFPGWSPDEYVLLEPKSVELDMFPLTFTCRSCGRAYRYKSTEAFNTAASSHGYRCPKCSGTLQQEDFVHYHTCGNIETMAIRRCEAHGYGDIRLLKSGASPAEWFWTCINEAHGQPHVLGPFGAHCYKHPTGQRMHHASFRKGEVFYPESISLVNVPPLARESRTIDDGVWKAVLAENLGLVEKGAAQKAARQSESEALEVSAASMRKSLEEDGASPEDIERLMKHYTASTPSGRLTAALKRVDDLIALDREALPSAATKIYEYMQVTRAESATSIQEAVARGRGPLAERARAAPTLLKECGFSDAFVTESLPLVKAVFGYSRGDPEKQESTLRSFEPNEMFKSKVPLYGCKINTEAIVFELDRLRVFDWLRGNGFVAAERPTGEAEVRAWFINNVLLDKIEPFRDIEQGADATKWVYRLIHSMSHLMLRQAAAFAGREKSSMGEVLFPNVPAFAIYANSSDEFSLGSMTTLFESSMVPWLEMCLEDVRHCLNDPMCIEDSGACFACLHIAEGSCEHFNRELGRDALIGSPNGIPRVGFWSGQ